MPFPRPTRTLLERMEWLADYWQWHFEFAHPAIKVGALETLLWNEIMQFSLLPRRTKLWWLELTQNGGNWAKLCRMLIVNGMYGGWQKRGMASTSKKQACIRFFRLLFLCTLKSNRRSCRSTSCPVSEPAEVNGLYGGGGGHDQPGEADGEAGQKRRSLWPEQNLNRWWFNML